MERLQGGFALSPLASKTEQDYEPLCMSALFCRICIKLIVPNTSSNPSLTVKALMASLTSLIVIDEKKAQSQYSNKVTVNQWSRAARRLKELREWCAKFGPDSDCR
jgi:hypothetical protein